MWCIFMVRFKIFSSGILLTDVEGLSRAVGDGESSGEHVLPKNVRPGIGFNAIHRHRKTENISLYVAKSMVIRT